MSKVTLAESLVKSEAHATVRGYSVHSLTMYDTTAYFVINDMTQGLVDSRPTLDAALELITLMVCEDLIKHLGKGVTVSNAGLRFIN